MPGSDQESKRTSKHDRPTKVPPVPGSVAFSVQIVA